MGMMQCQWGFCNNNRNLLISMRICIIIGHIAYYYGNVDVNGNVNVNINGSSNITVRNIATELERQ